MIRRWLVSFAAVLLLSFDGWGCSSPDLDLYAFDCVENGEPRMGVCCDPAAVCHVPSQCAIGVCTIRDGGVQ